VAGTAEIGERQAGHEVASDQSQSDGADHEAGCTCRRQSLAFSLYDALLSNTPDHELAEIDIPGNVNGKYTTLDNNTKWKCRGFKKWQEVANFQHSTL